MHVPPSNALNTARILPHMLPPLIPPWIFNPPSPPWLKHIYAVFVMDEQRMNDAACQRSTISSPSPYATLPQCNANHVKCFHSTECAMVALWHLTANFFIVPMKCSPL